MRFRPSIPTRILLGFFMALLAFATLSLWSFTQHARSERALRVLQEGYLPLVLSVGEAKANQTVFGTLLERVLEERESAATRSWLDSARRVRPATVQRALQRLARLERADLAPSDRRTLGRLQELLQKVQGTYVRTNNQYDAFFAALKAGDDAAAQRRIAPLKAAERDTRNYLRLAWRLLQQQMESTSASASQQVNHTLAALGVMILLAAIVGLMVTWWSHRVLNPIPLLHQRVAAVARGDLSRRLKARRDDELGDLTEQFENMVEALAARDHRLREAARHLQQMQQLQQQILSALPTAVIVIGPAGEVRTINRAAGPVLGVEQAVSEGTASASLLSRVGGLSECVQSILHGGSKQLLSAVPVLGSSERFVDVWVEPFDMNPGETGALIVADDVTEELNAKNQLIHTERLAAIGRMAAHVTHEVRNPLSSIGLNVELLEEEVQRGGPESAGLLRAIHKEIDRLTEITEEYLRLARLPEPRMEPDDVGALVRSVTEFLSEEMRRRQVRLQMEVDAALPFVAIDEAQVRQALLNLLRNSSEVTPAGGQVTVEVVRRDHHVVVRVRDEGPGIPPEHQPHIFDLFFTTKHSGSGLGLSLSRQIMLAHGGEIRCVNEDRAGAVFELWFPVQAEASSACVKGSGPSVHRAPLQDEMI